MCMYCSTYMYMSCTELLLRGPIVDPDRALGDSYRRPTCMHVLESEHVYLVLASTSTSTATLHVVHVGTGVLYL